MTRGTHSRWGWRGWVTLAVLGEALGGMAGAGAAPLPEGPVRGFNVPIVDRTTGRRKALVRGETARPAGQDTWEVSGVRLEYYSASDQTNLVVRTERCFYHLKAETLSSPAELKVATAANGLELQGIGFSWNAASGLLISNQVQGIIHPARFATESPGRLGVPGAAGSPRSGDPDRAIRVTSHRFRYHEDRASFVEEVRAEDSEGTLECGELTLQLATSLREVRQLEADRDVRWTFQEASGTAGRVVYDPGSELLTMTGSPTWKAGAREGKAGEIRINRRTRELWADQGVEMQVPAGSVLPAAAPFEAAQEERTGSEGAQRRVMIRCARLMAVPDPSRTNEYVIVCREQVRVNEREAELQCGVLRVRTLMPRYTPIDAVAEESVALVQGTNRLTCLRAVYEAVPARILLTGPVAWNMGPRSGDSDALVFDIVRRSMLASGNVRMRAPGSEVGGVTWLSPRTTTTTLDGGRDASVSRARGTEPVTIRCSEFEYVAAFSPSAPGSASYRGGVVVERGADDRLECGTLTAELDRSTNRVRRVIADEQVRVRANDNGFQRTARGDQAIYTVPDARLRLTGANGVEATLIDTNGVSRLQGSSLVYDGNRDTFEVDGRPVASTPQGTLTGDLLVVDRANGVVSARGRWRIEVAVKEFGVAIPELKAR